MSLSERATPLSQSHKRIHFLMAPIVDRNGDEWSPSHQSNQKCIFHISVIELCTSCKLMRSSPLQLWQESTNNYLPIFPYVAINLNHWQATAAPPRHRFSCSSPSPQPFPPCAPSCLSLSLLECLLVKAERNWQPIDVREPVGGSGLTWVRQAIKALQLLRGWEASRWLSPEILRAGTRRVLGAWEKCQRGIWFQAENEKAGPVLMLFVLCLTENEWGTWQESEFEWQEEEYR